MLNSLTSLSANARQYLLITGNYWAFTLTDGALRMMVLLYFHNLGYSPLAIAALFLFYEFFGVVTNLVGGWLGARIGLNRTMNIGLALQVIALAMLLVPNQLLTIGWVMAAQALSGIAKDLNKMSAKSAIKSLLPEDQENRLFRWVAALTGSKNTLKGIGFFAGGALLSLFEFRGAIAIMAALLAAVLFCSLLFLKKDLGLAKNKARFKEVFSKNRAINLLSLARLFLFCSRDVWFVIALPVYLSSQLHWDHWQIGSLLAGWVIIYGIIQALTPLITSAKKSTRTPDGQAAFFWAAFLALAPMGLASSIDSEYFNTPMLLLGLLVFGALFAINSALHSYLIVSYADRERSSMDIGFYYTANAMGRLIGTVLSGWIYQQHGLVACLYVSSVLICMTALISLKLPRGIRG